MLGLDVYIECFEMGVRDAYKVKVGDVYYGATSMAESYGFVRNSVEFDSYFAGYTCRLKRFDIRTDPDTFQITSITPLPRYKAA